MGCGHSKKSGDAVIQENDTKVNDGIISTVCEEESQLSQETAINDGIEFIEVENIDKESTENNSEAPTPTTAAKICVNASTILTLNSQNNNAQSDEKVHSDNDDCNENLLGVDENTNDETADKITENNDSNLNIQNNNVHGDKINHSDNINCNDCNCNEDLLHVDENANDENVNKINLTYPENSKESIDTIKKDEILMEGWVNKESISKSGRPVWNNRWMALLIHSNEIILRYFVRKGDKDPKGQIHLQGYSVIVEDDIIILQLSGDDDDCCDEIKMEIAGTGDINSTYKKRWIQALRSQLVDATISRTKTIKSPRL